MSANNTIRQFVPPHRRTSQRNKTTPDDIHINKSPTANQAVTRVTSGMNPVVMPENHSSQHGQIAEELPLQIDSPLSKPRSTSVSPLHGKNDKWIKDFDLKSGRWMANYNRDQVTKQKPNSRYKSELATWDDGTANEMSNGVSLNHQDPTYSIMNYDGSWAPAPEDWDSRPVFHNLLQSTENIQKWLDIAHNVREKEPLGVTVKDPCSSNFHQSITRHACPTSRYYFSCPHGHNNAPLMGDIVPISWKPPPMDGRSSLREFWTDHLKAPPTPCDQDDLENVQPWWEHYPSPIACFQKPLCQPEHRGIDVTDESEEERRLRECDMGSSHAIQRWKQGYRPGKNRGGARNGRGPGDWNQSSDCAKWDQIEEPARANSNIESTLTMPPDTSIKPKANLYLRRAQTSDMTQVTQIYNHYVENSLRVPETASVIPSHMHDRLRNIIAVSHRFLVACISGGPSDKATTKGPGKRNKGFPLTSTDRVIGFAYSDDFNDPAGMYRFLAEVEVYTDPEFLRKGVASCLMDKLIAMLDPSHIERGGYEFRDDDMGGDGVRLVNCLWINYPYVPTEDEKDWFTKWLSSIGFEQTGDHKNVAFKLGKSANLAVFTKTTGCEIDAANPPPGFNL